MTQFDEKEFHALFSKEIIKELLENNAPITVANEVCNLLPQQYDEEYRKEVQKYLAHFLSSEKRRANLRQVMRNTKKRYRKGKSKVGNMW